MVVLRSSVGTHTTPSRGETLFLSATEFWSGGAPPSRRTMRSLYGSMYGLTAVGVRSRSYRTPRFSVTFPLTCHVSCAYSDGFQTIGFATPVPMFPLNDDG